MELTTGPTPAAVVARTQPAATPSTSQLAWQREELALFVHLTVNTFTDREWGDGSEDPSIFDPAALDAGQWARTAREAGFGTVILTAKHHDGFCLWPTGTTTHSVSASPWRAGRGDVVRELADACAAEGLKLGLYCSPWDRNSPLYGTGQDYDDQLIAQITELLTGYGELAEVWFDGAVGATERGRQSYDWDRIFGTVRELQPNAVIFSDAGPGVRWVGNERGVAGQTSWSTVDPTRVPTPGRSDPWTIDSLQTGDPEGQVWRPTETDVSIRPGWFWHASENDRVCSPDELLELYVTSVGRNSKLLLNVPPNRDGRFDDADVAALLAFGERRRQVFGTDLLAGATTEIDDDGALVLTPPSPVTADLVSLSEEIEDGQHIAAFRVQVDDGSGSWVPLASGTTIGHKRIVRVPPTTVARLRVLLDLGYGPARLAAVALHHEDRGQADTRADSHD